MLLYCDLDLPFSAVRKIVLLLDSVQRKLKVSDSQGGFLEPPGGLGPGAKESTKYLPVKHCAVAQPPSAQPSATQSILFTF